MAIGGRRNSTLSWKRPGTSAEPELVTVLYEVQFALSIFRVIVLA